MADEYGAVEALGMIETRSYPAMVYEKTGGGHVTAVVRGDVAAVKAAVEAGARGAEKIGDLVAIHVIPRPHANVDRALPLGRQEAEGAKASKK
jgi:microcompartment protein CcmL/EutN